MSGNSFRLRRRDDARSNTAQERKFDGFDGNCVLVSTSPRSINAGLGVTWRGLALHFKSPWPWLQSKYVDKTCASGGSSPNASSIHHKKLTADGYLSLLYRTVLDDLAKP